MILDYGHLLLFLSAALLLNLSPGPDLFYVTSSAVANGRRVGLAAAFGIAVGAMFHVTLAALGLSAALATSDFAFSAVKLVGAAYLVYLGIKAIRYAGMGGLGGSGARMAATSAFRQGVLVDVMNPKPAIFFMAFLPQFAVPSAGHMQLQLMLLGTGVVLIGLLVEVAAVLGASQLTVALRARPKVGAWLDRLFGSLLIALGIRLAFQQRP